jgi:hypothetical protein
MTHCLREGGDPQRRARRRGFQYNAAEQATWGPVIKLMDDPLRLGAGRQPAKDGFSTRSGLCRLSRNKKMSGYPRDRVASCALARCPVSAPRRCHEVVPWQTVAAFERPLWRNVAIRSGSGYAFCMSGRARGDSHTRAWGVVGQEGAFDTDA